MSRTILDCKTNEIADLSPDMIEKLEKTFDRLNVPQDSTVQINVGVSSRVERRK